MKRFLAILLGITCSYNLFSQSESDSIYTRLWANKDSSIFKPVSKGVFTGTANGHFQLMNGKDSLVLDFQSTKTILTITPEKTVHHSSIQRYVTQTADNSATLTYELHTLTNLLTLQLNGETYGIGKVNGTADKSVPGLVFNYFSEKNTEYLTLFVMHSFELSAAKESIQQKKINHPETGKPVKSLSLLAGSTLIFTIKK